jgi:hypothetical protein
VRTVEKIPCADEFSSQLICEIGNGCGGEWKTLSTFSPAVLKQSDPLFDMSLQNAKNPPMVWFATVEIPVGVAWRMSPEAFIPAVGPDELPLVPSLAVNDHDRTLLAVRTQESHDETIEPVTWPGVVVKL